MCIYWLTCVFDHISICVTNLTEFGYYTQISTASLTRCLECVGRKNFIGDKWGVMIALIDLISLLSVEFCSCPCLP